MRIHIHMQKKYIQDKYLSIEITCGSYWILKFNFVVDALLLSPVSISQLVVTSYFHHVRDTTVKPRTLPHA